MSNSVNGSVGGTSTINSDDRLLLQVLDHGGRGGPSSAGGGGGSVSTADLLDLLERSVNDRDQQLIGVNNSAGCLSDNDGSRAKNNRHRGGGRSKKLRSSFTSRLLGGQSDDDDGEVLLTSTSTSNTFTNSHSLANKEDHNNDLAQSAGIDKSQSAKQHRMMQTTASSTPGVGGGGGEDDAKSMGSWGKLYPNNRNSNNRSKNSNSGTFSIQEDNQSIDDTTTSAAGFSLGSLASGGYEVPVSTRSSRQSNRSNKSKSSHDSGPSGASSCSAHSSQHSGDSTQERRRRRELVPVKKKDDGDAQAPVVGMRTSSSGVSELSSVTTGERQKKNQQQQRKQMTKKSSSLSSTTKTTTTDGGVTAMVNKYQPKRNLRKKSSSMSSGGSSRSSGSNSSDLEVNEGDEEFHGENLHNHHSVRHPRRSSNPFHVVGEESDAIATIDEPSSLAHRQHHNHSKDDDDDEDGLFRRVNRVRDSGNSDGQLKTTDFLDGLIASTTTVKRNGGIIGRRSVGGVDAADDGVSVDDQSFLSELLARNNSARQRGIGTRRGIADNSTVTSGMTLSSHSTLRNYSESDKIDFINIYALDANNTKRERKQRRIKQHQWRFDIMGVKQQYDIVILKVQQSYVYQRIVEQCFNNEDGEGGRKCKIMLENIRESNMYNKVQLWYNEGGIILPQNRKEVVMFLVSALLLWPLVHVAITIVTGSYVYDSSSSSSGGGMTRGAYYGSEIQVGGISRYNSKKMNKMPGLYSMGESMHAWAGSSQVMLSSRSSLREDFILIPDADWIELQILRSKVASSKLKSDNNRGGNGGDGGGFFPSFFRKQSNIATSYDMTFRKPPKRLPLPPILDPVYNTTASIVLFTINCGPLPHDKQMVWRLLQSSLLPRPIDVWPSWSHNSLAQYREDGFTVMYPIHFRGEARIALTKLVNKKVVDQSYIYEYLTWSETTSHPNIGENSGVRGGSTGLSVEERAGSVRLVGKDGSAIVIPKLPNGRSDIMIRRTISTTAVLSDPQDEPTVIMRRVMDLPVEDELTMKEWEGPSLEEIVWSKEKM